MGKGDMEDGQEMGTFGEHINMVNDRGSSSMNKSH